MAAERVERRLAAVLAADVAGYSRLMGADEEGTLARLKALRKTLVDPTIASYRGRLVKTTGDGMLVEFGSVVDAVRGSLQIQREMAEQNAPMPQDKRIEFRIGIHVGDIIFDDDDIFGDGVNLAARLEGIAEPGGICISDDAQRQIRGKVDIAFDDLGPQVLKNIAEPMRAWRARLGKEQISAPPQIAPTERSPVLALPDKPSIAVLPFQNMSDDPEQEYFADGVVEDIITALSRFGVLFVIARNSSFTYKGKVIDIKQAGRELGVRYALEGSVRKAGGRVRITGQLIDAVSGHHVWADKFEGELQDIFGLQEDVVARVVGALVPALELSEMGRLQRTHQSSQTAYDVFLRARAHTYRGEFRRGVELCYEAIKKDPEFAQAYAAAAIAFTGAQAVQGVPLSPEQKEEAIGLANRALTLESNNAAILYRAGQVLAVLAKEFERGSALIEQAAALNPNLSDIWYARAVVGLMNGDAERALESCFRFLRISPMDPIAPWVWSALSMACFQLGRYDEGCSWGAKAIQQKTAVFALTSFIANAVKANRMDDARRAATQLLQSQPKFCISLVMEIMPTRTPEIWARAREALLAAGLPD